MTGRLRLPLCLPTPVCAILTGISVAAIEQPAHGYSVPPQLVRDQRVPRQAQRHGSIPIPPYSRTGVIT